LINPINYIRRNPVKHRIVQDVKDLEYSFFHKFVRQGFYGEKPDSGAVVKNINNLNLEFLIIKKLLQRFCRKFALFGKNICF